MSGMSISADGAPLPERDGGSPSDGGSLPPLDAAPFASSAPFDAAPAEVPVVTPRPDRASDLISDHTANRAPDRTTAPAADHAPDAPNFDEPRDTGPTISRGAWLAEPDHWLITGSHKIPRPDPGPLPRPHRFRHVPRWVSALILGAILVLAIAAGAGVARLAQSIAPAHQPTTQPSHHTPTPSHKATPTPHK